MSPAQPGGPIASPRHLTRLILGNLVVFGIFWLLIEVACGQLFRHLPPKYANGKRLVSFLLSGKRADESASMQAHPYLLYANTPLYVAEGFRQHNSLGYRGPECSLVKASDTIRILCLGGSTTYGFKNPDPGTTWPALLEKRLRQTVSPKIEVINGGLNYATTAEVLAGYVFRHAFLHPDIIVYHGGGNDAVATIFPDYHPEYSHFRAHGKVPSLRRWEASLLRSDFVKLWYAIWLNYEEAVYVSQPFPFDRLKSDEAMARALSPANYLGFRRNLESLITFTRSNGSRLLLFGFLNARPERYSRNLPILAGIQDALLEATSRNNTILKELGDRFRLPCLIPDQDRFQDDWFLDNCHLTPAGEEVKAALVAGEITRMLALPTPDTVIPAGK